MDPYSILIPPCNLIESQKSTEFPENVFIWFDFILYLEVLGILYNVQVSYLVVEYGSSDFEIRATDFFSKGSNYEKAVVKQCKIFKELFVLKQQLKFPLSF